MQKEPALKLDGISKHFGNYTANDKISFQVLSGEIHALLGENGAGKSTLMNILYGTYRADEGEIYIKGKKASIHSAKDAIRLGLGMVHQHFMLIEKYTAIENIYLLGKESPFSIASRKKIAIQLNELKEKYKIDVDINCPIEKLSIGMQQKIEILKLLYTGAEILILDEPTAVLTPQESNTLFDIIKNLSREGKSIIFISHKLEEVLDISSRITVLAHGKVVGEMKTKDASKEKIIKLMVGEDLKIPMIKKEKNVPKMLTPIFQMENGKAKDDRGIQTLNGVTFSLFPGEIIGIASIEGNGQIELAEVVAGVRRLTCGSIMINGEKMTHKGPQEFIRRDVEYIPADRNTVGSVPDFPLFENWVLRSQYRKGQGMIINYTNVKSQTQKAVTEYNIRTQKIEERSGNLSGGNLQKLILARALMRKPKILVCTYPTRGLDVKAAWFIRGKISTAKRNGMAVLLISGDFEELFALSDRIVVIHRGKIVGEVVPEKSSPEEIGAMMMGVGKDEIK